jgi:glycosyltransferase involved in cell wall biosynthesis
MTRTKPIPTVEGARICLVFEHSLSHYTRLRSEIAALQEAGFVVSLLTANKAHEEHVPGVDVTHAPLASVTSLVRPSSARQRFVRIASNLLRRPVRYVVDRVGAPLLEAARRRVLDDLASRTDIFWVIDYPSLPAVVGVAERRSVPVIYETVDLVPEYLYRGERHHLRALASERTLIPKVDGFITACDSYADYYMERYGDIIGRRPLVRDNMPEHLVADIRPTGQPLRLLFLGSLMFDRPVAELIEAMALTSAPVVLTIQGRNYLGEAPARRLAELGLGDRVRIVGPCPPEAVVETAAAYDVGVVALKGENENERRASTSKLYTYMAAGLAILGSNLPGIASVVKEHGNGILVDDMTPAAWAQGFENTAMLEPREIDRMKHASLAAARVHAWERQKPEFIAEFARVLGLGNDRGAR